MTVFGLPSHGPHADVDVRCARARWRGWGRSSSMRATPRPAGRRRAPLRARGGSLYRDVLLVVFACMSVRVCVCVRVYMCCIRACVEGLSSCDVCWTLTDTVRVVSESCGDVARGRHAHQPMSPVGEFRRGLSVAHLMGAMTSQPGALLVDLSTNEEKQICFRLNARVARPASREHCGSGVAVGQHPGRMAAIDCVRYALPTVKARPCTRRSQACCRASRGP